jgi:hypothetical protein
LAAVVFVVVPALIPSCQAKTPPPEDVIEVSLVSLPKTDARMAQMDVAPPTLPSPVVPDAPAPERDPGTADQGAPEPEPPVNPSDLAFREKDAPKEAKGDPDRERREELRRDLIRQAQRQALLDAAAGTEPSQAGDPDSTTTERIDLGGPGTVADPELARYVQSVRTLFMQNFRPLPTVAQQNPDLVAMIQVRFDPASGSVQTWVWTKKSGNVSWDAAAERAVEAVTRVPLPPEKHAARFADGYTIRFNAKDYL